MVLAGLGTAKSTSECSGGHLDFWAKSAEHRMLLGKVAAGPTWITPDSRREHSQRKDSLKCGTFVAMYWGACSLEVFFPSFNKGQCSYLPQMIRRGALASDCSSVNA